MPIDPKTGKEYPYTEEGIEQHKKDTGGMPYAPFKMKGSPIQRNFGIGSPVKQEEGKLKKEGKKKYSLMEKLSTEDWKNIAELEKKRAEDIKSGKIKTGDPNVDPNTGKPYKSERDKAVLSYDFDSPHHPKNDPKPE